MGKEYLAVIHGCPEKRDGEFFDYLFHNVSNNMTYVVNNLRKGVKEAQLEYHVIETVNSPDGVLSLIRINLLTGRTHQIRVQFSSRKLMLYGDNRYGARDSGGISLFSHSISFVQQFVVSEVRS